MIGEALEITIVVSMLVLVGYPSTLMILEALRARRRRRVRVANRNLNNPVVFERRHFPEQRPETVFNDKGIFSNALFFEAESHSALRLDYIYQRVLNPKDVERLAGEQVNSVLVDRAVQEVMKENLGPMHSLKMEGSFDKKCSQIDDLDFFSFLITLQHQVAICSKINIDLRRTRDRVVFDGLGRRFVDWAAEKDECLAEPDRVGAGDLHARRKRN